MLEQDTSLDVENQSSISLLKPYSEITSIRVTLNANHLFNLSRLFINVFITANII